MEPLYAKNESIDYVFTTLNLLNPDISIPYEKENSS